MGGTFRDRGWEDREVTILKNDLLVVLRENRQNHIDDYKLACAGYRKAALAKIEEVTNDLKAKINGLQEGQTIAVMGVSFGLPFPQSHEKAYNQIIRMLEMSVDERFVLTSGQFACFVMDDWDWKQEWGASNSSYFGGISKSWKPE